MTSQKANVLIRPLSENDIDSVRLILKSVGWEDPFFQEQKVNDGETYVAAINDPVVGYIRFQHLKWNRLSYLHNLVVSRDYRRLGIAKQLILHAEKESRQIGNKGLFLDTKIDNTGGRDFYKALGYTETGELMAYYDSGVDGVTYIKRFER